MATYFREVVEVNMATSSDYDALYPSIIQTFGLVSFEDPRRITLPSIDFLLEQQLALKKEGNIPPTRKDDSAR